MNEGQRWKTKLWRGRGRAELEKLALAPWGSRRRQELLELLDRVVPIIEESLLRPPLRCDDGRMIRQGVALSIRLMFNEVQSFRLHPMSALA